MRKSVEFGSARGDSIALSGHKQNAQHFAHACESARVNLAHVDCFGLEQLLKHHPVVRVLSRRDADPVRLQCLANRGMAKDVVRCSGLLDKPEIICVSTLWIVRARDVVRTSTDQGLISARLLT